MKSIQIAVNPNVEMMNIILFTSKYREICNGLIGTHPLADLDNQYAEEIWAHFKPFTQHGVYQKLESMVPEGFFFGRPMELMLSVEALPALKEKYQMSPFALQLSGGQPRVDELLELLRDFAITTDCQGFLGKTQFYYDDYLAVANKRFSQYPFIEAMESFYNMGSHRYNFIVSSLLKGSFGIHFHVSATELDMYSVFAVGAVGKEELNDFKRAAASANIIFHEYSHPMINPLTEKNRELVQEYSKAYERLQPYKQPTTGYGDWEECVNEHIIRAISVYLVRTHCNKEYGDWNFQHDYDLGYRYLPHLLDRIHYYESNRPRYQTFEEFYPEILMAFRENI